PASCEKTARVDEREERGMAGLRLREVRPVLTMFALVMLVISPHGALATSTSKSDCGRGWRISPSPSPSSSILYGVASFPQGTAWAVGDIHPVFRSSTLALHNDGSGWTQVPTQNPGLESNRLYAVDGASDDDVWAVGTSGDGTL